MEARASPAANGTAITLSLSGGMIATSKDEQKRQNTNRSAFADHNSLAEPASVGAFASPPHNRPTICREHFALLDWGPGHAVFISTVWVFRSVVW